MRGDTGMTGRPVAPTGASIGARRLRGAETEARAFRIGKDLSPLQAHDLVTEGLPVERARDLIASFRILDRETVLRTIGVSDRTLQRAKVADKPLDTNASDRVLRLASVVEQAIDVLGSQDAAERWLSTPAMGLDRRLPVDLLQSSKGTELVKTLLTRMDYGVYA
jgi:putative toxin-antitoxin system antitoxin component (TIGR02293 family)